MSDLLSDTPPASNNPELSVSELSGALKRTIESTFDHVRVRGELGRVAIAKSGHMYCDMKDDKAVLSTVMWKGNVSRLPFRPKEGLEVVAEGKLSTFPGRSNYQLIADTMRPAGAGALMALLEERKKKLAAEGLFDGAHKKRLPYLPRTIGVVTSPTGAVIRDILHRIRDRFPVRVIVWPALVQGDLAARQITVGIEGFNRMTGPDRPELLIVARGGGSIEDLWPFNEENVVRAAFASDIPLISAVGHETDTTLIDYVSDMRAPTPTGAAEIAVPVRGELMETLVALDGRLKQSLQQSTRHKSDTLRGLAARLPHPTRLLESKQQRFDLVESRLSSGLKSAIHEKRAEYLTYANRLRPKTLNRDVQNLSERLANVSQRHASALARSNETHRQKLTQLEQRLVNRCPTPQDPRYHDPLAKLGGRLQSAIGVQVERRGERLDRLAKLLDTLSYQSTLKRGFALVRDSDGQLVRNASAMKSGASYRLQFADDSAEVEFTGSSPGKSGKQKKKPPAQGTLF